MRMKLKLMLLGLSAGMIALQAAQCARFWGDLLGDIVWLRGID